jgi:hypothetical protein
MKILTEKPLELRYEHNADLKRICFVYFTKLFFIHKEYFHGAVFFLTSQRLWSALFWAITQLRMVTHYWSFGTTYGTLEDGTDGLSRNVGKGLPLDAALYPRRAQISSTLRRKPEITESQRRVSQSVQFPGCMVPKYSLRLQEHFIIFSEPF